MATVFGKRLLTIGLIGAAFVGPHSWALDDYLDPVQVGLITDARIQELSGMVPVTGRPHHYWIHNDSADVPRVFAVSEEGLVVAEVVVTGAGATDWEDISRGPGPESGRGYLYIADTGNNALSRAELTIYRIPEPILPNLLPGQRLASEPAESIPFRYPDGTHDCEALVVHPLTGDIYLITKAADRAGVYRFAVPAPGQPVQTLVHLGDMRPGGLVTAADVADDGSRILVRTYTQVLEYALPEGLPFEDTFFQTPRALPASTAEPKSESICFDPEVPEYLTSNEGNPAPIHRAFRKVPHPSCRPAAEVVASLSFVRGNVVDENVSGGAAVNITDAVAIFDAARDAIELPCGDAADFDDSGVQDLNDVTAALNALVRGTGPRPPFPLPGVDSTTDGLACYEADRLTLSEEHDAWDYWYAPSPPADGWNLPEAEVSGWSVGTGGIGFGTGGLGTTLPGPPDQSYTLYARHEFELTDPRTVDGAVLELDWNDGFVAYLNGVEAARQGLGTDGFEVPAQLPGTLHGGGRFEDVLLCPEPMRAGVNVLALEIHNRLISDPTLFFRASLRTFALGERPHPISGPPPGEGGRLRLDVDRPPSLGGTGTIRVLADFDVPIRGSSLGIRFEPGRIRVTGVRAGANLRDTAMEGSYLSSFTGRVGHAMVLAPALLPAGQSVELAVLDFTVTATEPTETRIAFESVAARLPLENLLVSEDLRTLRPKTEDLVVAILDAGLPTIDSIVDGIGTAGAAFFVVGRGFEASGLQVRVCEKEAAFSLLADGQTLRVIAPVCGRAGPAVVTVCTDAGCASDEVGFTYESPGLVWIRGDANGDALVDVSDPISMLGQLFLGSTTTPSCDVALDANADGRFDLSDAIFLLLYLFQGGGPIPPPYPEPRDCP